ncbi:hypothetical protein JTE90_014095 [Oedothorax gibbosus]|uniref:Uncharacterized protein n=1 Tax=Oedothorax gibbosus TaxID=931172 RepID=A0AAV6V9C7_9ARAC|nr:hypothetical protein JTE90_014095 [Oedothorax gibbosus]
MLSSVHVLEKTSYAKSSYLTTDVMIAVANLCLCGDFNGIGLSRKQVYYSSVCSECDSVGCGGVVCVVWV